MRSWRQHSLRRSDPTEFGSACLRSWGGCSGGAGRDPSSSFQRPYTALKYCLRRNWCDSSMRVCGKWYRYLDKCWSTTGSWTARRYGLNRSYDLGGFSREFENRGRWSWVRWWKRRAGRGRRWWRWNRRRKDAHTTLLLSTSSSSRSFHPLKDSTPFSSTRATTLWSNLRFASVDLAFLMGSRRQSHGWCGWNGKS